MTQIDDILEQAKSMIPETYTAILAREVARLRGLPVVTWLPAESCPMHKDVMLFRADAGVMFGHRSYLADWFLSDEEQEEYDEETLFHVDFWWFNPRGVDRLEGDCIPTHWAELPAEPQA